MFCSWPLQEGRGEENSSSTHFYLMNSWPARNSLWSRERLLLSWHFMAVSPMLLWGTWVLSSVTM